MGHSRNGDGETDGSSGTTEPQDGDHWEEEEEGND